MEMIQTTACVICGGEPDRPEDVELKVTEQVEPKPGFLMRQDPPPSILVKGRICQTCCDNLHRLPTR
jgi:hypothetical protein